jgi:nucleotide-binding universal stress UspA family protein
MKVLIAVDDSECSREALENAADRSWPEGSEFRIISVIEPMAMQYGFAEACALETVVVLERKVRDLCNQFIEGKVEKLAALFGKGRVSGEVLDGFVAERIIDEAKRWNADLIIVGSHGRRGVSRFLLGSVAEKVVCNAPCSIEVVKAKAAREVEDKLSASRPINRVMEMIGTGD